jgi:hypothetical protein
MSEASDERIAIPGHDTVLPRPRRINGECLSEPITKLTSARASAAANDYLGRSFLPGHTSDSPADEVRSLIDRRSARPAELLDAVESPMSCSGGARMPSLA